jgi:hypothetical protein
VEDPKAADDDDDERKGRAGSEMVEGEVVGEEATADGTQDDDDDGYEHEYIEVEVDEYDDRGVAPAMLKVYNPEIRLHMLIVHGMLHLVGNDHIEDDDYEVMVVREDEVMAELKKRLGDDFGVAVSLPSSMPLHPINDSDEDDSSISSRSSTSSFKRIHRSSSSTLAKTLPSESNVDEIKSSKPFALAPPQHLQHPLSFVSCWATSSPILDVNCIGVNDKNDETKE